jgi:stage V sporulation protein B
VPAVSEEKGKEARRKTMKSLGITALVALPCAVALYLFAPTIVKIVYSKLSGEEKEILVKLVRLFSVSAVTLSCLQTASACLTARGRAKLSTLAVFVGVAVKIGLDYWLVSKPQFSVYGAVIATNVCYAVAFLLAFVFHLRIEKRGRAKKLENE